jgi:hypothetical protein
MTYCPTTFYRLTALYRSLALLGAGFVRPTGLTPVN